MTKELKVYEIEIRETNITRITVEAHDETEAFDIANGYVDDHIESIVDDMDAGGLGWEFSPAYESSDETPDCTYAEAVAAGYLSEN